MALPLIGVVIALVGTAIGAKAYKEAKKGNLISLASLEETKRGNNIGIIGVLIGTITSIVMIWAFIPDSVEDFDVKNYYEDGILHFTGNGSVEDKKGIWNWYSKNGILIKMETYNNNKLDGSYKEFYENGNLKIQGEYADGEKEFNKWKCFDLDSSIKKCLEN